MIYCILKPLFQYQIMITIVHEEVGQKTSSFQLTIFKKYIYKLQYKFISYSSK